MKTVNKPKKCWPNVTMFWPNKRRKVELTKRSIQLDTVAGIYRSAPLSGYVWHCASGYIVIAYNNKCLIKIFYYRKFDKMQNWIFRERRIRLSRRMLSQILCMEWSKWKCCSGFVSIVRDWSNAEQLVWTVRVTKLCVVMPWFSHKRRGFRCGFIPSEDWFPMVISRKR